VREIAHGVHTHFNFAWASLRSRQKCCQGGRKVLVHLAGLTCVNVGRQLEPVVSQNRQKTFVKLGDSNHPGRKKDVLAILSQLLTHAFGKLFHALELLDNILGQQTLVYAGEVARYRSTKF
jgi:hypothetical protein